MGRFFIFIISTILIFCSCDNKGSITNGNIVYVDKFKNEKMLSGKPLSFIESKGVFGCEIRMPYLFLNLYRQNNYIAVYDLEAKRFVGDCFTKGKSGDEYIDFDIVNQYNDSVFWTIDPQKKLIREFSYITHSNDSGKIFEEIQRLRCKMNADLFCTFVKDDMIYAYKAFSIKDGLYYQNCKTNKKIAAFNKNIKNNDLNRIKTLAESMKPDGSKVVSFTGVWDEIDIISLDGNTDENISITTSNDLMTWDEYKELAKDNLKDYYISIQRSNDEYIAVLHDNQKNHEILIFDWKGNGIARCQLKEKLIDFAIDWETNTIYGLTENEVVYKYDTFN